MKKDIEVVLQLAVVFVFGFGFVAWGAQVPLAAFLSNAVLTAGIGALVAITILVVRHWVTQTARHIPDGRYYQGDL